MQSGKKIAAFLLAAAMLGTTFSGCSSKKEENGKSEANSAKTSSGTVSKVKKPALKKDASLVVWVDQESQNMLKSQVDNFKKDTPEAADWNVTIKVVDESKTSESVKNDPSAAADIFGLPHDQLGALVNQGALYEVTQSKCKQDIKDNNIKTAVNAVTYKDKIYAFPHTVETCVLFYDKSKLSADDVKTLDGMLKKKAKVAFDFGNAYNSGPLFMSNGCEFFGKDGTDDKVLTFNDEKGQHVLKWITELKGRGMLNMNPDQMKSQAKAHKLDACFDGPWNANEYKKAWGDNFAVAKYPMVNFGDGEVQMQAFQGVKCYAVKAQTKYPAEAMALADYLTNEKCQLDRFKQRNATPSNKNAQSDSAVQNDPVVKIVAQMATDASTIMPKVGKVAGFWAPTAAVTKDAFDGKIKQADIKKKLDTLVNDILNPVSK